MASTFLDKRFVIVAGKGGVGKSVVCAALGLVAARAGKRTVIAELNTREKAPLLFGKPPNGYDTGEIYPNLFSINIQPEPALREYGLMKLKFERVYKLVFENPAMKRLLRMTPGMNELFLLGKAFNMERERTRSDEPAWDMIIVDAPATGHGVSLLRLPQVILSVSSTGAMADEVRDMQGLLTDPRRTSINLVSLPEEMPYRETLELASQVEDVLKIPTGYLFINGIWPQRASEAERAVLDGIFEAHAATDPRVAAVQRCTGAMDERASLQARYVKTLRDTISLPTIELPFLFTREFGFDSVDTLSRCIVDQMGDKAASGAA